MVWWISFVGGASYGITSVIVGQPLDSLKTMMQSRTGYTTLSTLQACKKLAAEEGIKGFYRGGTPIFLGGALVRTCQFGVFDATKRALEGKFSSSNTRILHPATPLAGLVGGACRAVIECPFEFIKVRRQVNTPWSFKDAYQGFSIMIVRNSALFSCFVSYMEMLKHSVNLPPFLLGAFGANLAWLTVWPLDVLKTQRQSGRYEGMSAKEIFIKARKEGRLFRGIVPGLIRSSIANGSSMFVMTHVKDYLERI